MTPGPLGHIGRYELLAKLAAGGMGEVFLARTTGTGGFEKRLVIKRILPHLADDPEFIRRFIAEGKLVVRLRHAGIAQVLDMGEEGGVTFIAMEHVDGRDLGELVRLARTGGVGMPVPLIVTIIVRLLEALDYAHNATDDDGVPLGIIHRDISPSNVMISRTGEVKLLDFGIARATERMQTTTAGAIRGKYSYMSPQQAAGADLDARSDLFSVGVLMWELLAGFRPFDGASDLLTLDRIRFFDPGSLPVAAPGVPGPVGAVVDRLLRKDPADRFPSAEAAMRALMAWQNESGALVVPRDLSAWLERVLETLPEAMRKQPAAGLSLDDVLLMGLGSDPGQRKRSTAPVSDRASFTRTVSAPGVSPPRPGEPAVTGPGVAGVVATQTGLAAPPLPSAAPAVSAPYPTDPDTPAVAAARPRARRGIFALLVILNLLLLGAVAWLVVKAGEDETPPSGELVALADVVEAPDAQAATAPLVVATIAPDAAPLEPADTAVAAAEETVAPALDVVVEVTSGSAFGALVADLADTLAPAEATLTVRAVPGGVVSITGFGSGPSPRSISGRPGTVLKGRVTLDDYFPRTFEAVLGEDDVLHLTLKAVPRGTLTFRFFPASANLFIDGVAVNTKGTNLVTRELPVGPHRLKLVGPDGRRVEKAFEVGEGKTTNLYTLDAGSGAETP